MSRSLWPLNCIKRPAVFTTNVKVLDVVVDVVVEPIPGDGDDDADAILPLLLFVTSSRSFPSPPAVDFNLAEWIWVEPGLEEDKVGEEEDNDDDELTQHTSVNTLLNISPKIAFLPWSGRVSRIYQLEWKNKGKEKCRTIVYLMFVLLLRL